MRGKGREGGRSHRVKTGAHTRIRTGDLILTKDALCQLSYVGLYVGGGGVEPP